MFIVIGWAKDAKELAYAGIEKCPNCKNWAHFTVYEFAKKVSVFFVKVARFSKKYYLVCNVCQAGAEISPREKDEFLRGTISLPSQEEVEEIWSRLVEIWSDFCASSMNRGKQKNQFKEEVVETEMELLKQEYAPQDVDYVSSRFYQYLLDNDRPR